MMRSSSRRPGRDSGGGAPTLPKAWKYLCASKSSLTKCTSAGTTTTMALGTPVDGETASAIGAAMSVGTLGLGPALAVALEDDDDEVDTATLKPVPADPAPGDNKDKDKSKKKRKAGAQTPPSPDAAGGGGAPVVAKTVQARAADAPPACLSSANPSPENLHDSINYL